MGNILKNNVVCINLCSSCRRALKGEWSFCPFCKTSVEVLSCFFCKREIKNSWSYCPYCTNEVREIDKQDYKVNKGNDWLRSILED